MEPRFEFNDAVGVVTVRAYADDAVLDPERTAYLTPTNLSIPLNLGRTLDVTSIQRIHDAVDACLFAGVKVVVTPAALRVYQAVSRCLEAEERCLG